MNIRTGSAIEITNDEGSENYLVLAVYEDELSLRRLSDDWVCVLRRENFGLITNHNVQLFTGHKYVAMGERGEYIRDAAIIGELPHELRLLACELAALALGMSVEFGVKLKQSNNIKPGDAAMDTTGLLDKRGEDLPLTILV